MAETAKKGKKKKATKTLNLSEFLSKDAPTSVASHGSSHGSPFTNRSSSWADEAEGSLDLDVDTRWPEESFGGTDSRRRPVMNRAALPTAPRASRASEVDTSKIPNDPPFTAFLGNLPYDVEKDDILEFFRDTKITEVRLPQDSGGGRPKGFGYAEFADKASLIQALDLNNEAIRSRKIRVDVAGNQQGADGSSRGERRQESIIPDGDWRSNKPPAETQSQGGGGFDDYNGYSRGPREDGPFGRPRDTDSYGSREDRFGSRDNRYSSHDERNGSRDDRYGGRDDRTGGRDGRFGGHDDRFGGRDDRFGGRDDRFGGRDGRFGGGDRDRGFGSRDDRGYGSGWGGRDGDRDRREPGRDGRYGDRYGDGGRGGDRYGDDRGRDSDQPKERPKIKLQPRSKPTEETKEKGPETRSSIFGAAKPVDTTTKEKEIEEKLAKASIDEVMHKEEHGMRRSEHDEWKRGDHDEWKRGGDHERRGRRDSNRSSDGDKPSGRSRKDSNRSVEEKGSPKSPTTKAHSDGPKSPTIKAHIDGPKSSTTKAHTDGPKSPTTRAHTDGPKSPTTKAPAQGAPPPPVNVWAKRMEAQKASASTESATTAEIPDTTTEKIPPQNPSSPQAKEAPRGEADGRDMHRPTAGRGRGGMRGWGRGRGRGDHSHRGDRQPAPADGGSEGSNKEEKKEQREKRPPQPKKYHEEAAPVFHKQSKFSLLMADDDEEEAPENAES